MNWKERLEEHFAPGRTPGRVVFRLPEDLDALVADWRELQAAVWLLRRDCERMGGSSWRATPAAKATARWEK